MSKQIRVDQYLSMNNFDEGQSYIFDFYLPEGYRYISSTYITSGRISKIVPFGTDEASSDSPAIRQRLSVEMVMGDPVVIGNGCEATIHVIMEQGEPFSGVVLNESITNVSPEE